MAEVPEEKHLTCFATINHTDEILTRYSNISRLIIIVAYCLPVKHPHRLRRPPTVKELQTANDRIIKLVQASVVAQDLHNLKSGIGMHAKSKLLPLHSFIGEKSILRVGGRLQNSAMHYDQKHPILLPKSHHITNLIIRETHLRHHRAGITTTLYTV